MCKIIDVSKRELISYFQTPVAYVFCIVYLIASGSLTFYLSNYFNRGIADLQPFFMWQPWLYMFLVPAISMRLWAEEKRTSTVEFLTSLPVSWWQLVLGKFFASWIFLTIALACTMPIWLSANYLGSPDNGVILAGYFGCVLMLGSYLAIGCAASAMTSNQIIAFIIACLLCLIFLMSGYPLVIEFFQGWLNVHAVEAISNLSFLSNFEAISKGVIELKTIIFFVSLILFWLWLTKRTLQYKISGGV